MKLVTDNFCGIAGFGNHIYWLTLDNGLQIAQNDDKPLMLLIHKTWCGACKALKPQFAASEEIEKLSKHFVMVNTQDDEEPKGSMFAPDGGYIPRILFLDPNGVVMDEYYNEEGNPDYKYFYSDSKSVVSSMKRVLRKPTKHSKVTDEL
uniref:Thioredoxin domain-containing protein 12 n=2 Tax=Timema TaxID=61471 RepID=A0A7R9D1L6_TIMPO|nr:unnamed protein product [Timema douglasi]CAD7405481.1 unnamed protein product [Timema poppensis]